MLKKAIFSFSFAILATAAVFAQAQVQPVDDYKKGEFYVGYSNGQVDSGVDSGNSPRDFFRDRANFNGVNVSGVYNATRYLGIKGDLSATVNRREFAETFSQGGANYTVGFDNSNQLWNFVGGVQVKDNEKSGTFKPFAHAMAGIAHGRAKVENFTCTMTTLGANCAQFNPGSTTLSSTGFGGVFGGGIDIRLNNKVQIRAIQFDYNPTRLEGTWQHNARIGAGIVF
jgi:opacity protein-like surface antigen